MADSDSVSQKLENFFRVREKVKIFNFIGFFFLKGKLVEPETFSGVSCPDTEGLWKVWAKTESWFPIQPPKNLENFFRVGEKVKISNFIGFFFLKGKLVILKLSEEFSVLTLKGYGKFGAKLHSSFQFRVSKTWKFLSSGEKVRISNFIGFFFVKRKLVQPETLSGVSCPDTEGLWKVWGKTELGFPIQPPKNLWISF